MTQRRKGGPTEGCLLRLQKDLEEIDQLDAKLNFFDQRVLQRFVVRIVPPDGIWRGAKFDFEFEIPDEWPMKPPKVKCLTPIWHPNIGLPPESRVCLNVLRKNYTPATPMSHLIAALQYLFSAPDPLDPLNFEAATQYIQRYAAFRLKAEEYIQNHCPQD
jgi:ubiquitin-conjugating enzyme E2 M